MTEVDHIAPTYGVTEFTADSMVVSDFLRALGADATVHAAFGRLLAGSLAAHSAVERHEIEVEPASDVLDEGTTPQELRDEALTRLVQALRTWSRAWPTKGDRQIGVRAMFRVQQAFERVEETRKAFRPGICTECGCTDDNACRPEPTAAQLKAATFDGGVATVLVPESCSWVDESRTLCTACDASDGAS